MGEHAGRNPAATPSDPGTGATVPGAAPAQPDAATDASLTACPGSAPAISGDAPSVHRPGHIEVLTDTALESRHDALRDVTIGARPSPCPDAPTDAHPDALPGPPPDDAPPAAQPTALPNLAPDPHLRHCADDDDDRERREGRDAPAASGVAPGRPAAPWNATPAADERAGRNPAVAPSSPATLAIVPGAVPGQGPAATPAPRSALDEHRAQHLAAYTAWAHRMLPVCRPGRRARPGPFPS